MLSNQGSGAKKEKQLKFGEILKKQIFDNFVCTVMGWLDRVVGGRDICKFKVIIPQNHRTGFLCK